MVRLLGREPASGSADSVNDLDVGSDALQSVSISGRRCVWELQLRTEVLKRAEGRCEHCGEEEFLKADGTWYLEAHFGWNRASLEAQMIQIVRRKERLG
jgi:hypothetical protein